MIYNLAYTYKFQLKTTLASKASDRKNDIYQYSKKIFSKHQNKGEFKNLDESEVLNSYLSGLITSAAFATSLTFFEILRFYTDF